MRKRKRDRKAVAGAAVAASGDGGREAGRFSARRKTETILLGCFGARRSTAWRGSSR